MNALICPRSVWRVSTPRPGRQSGCNAALARHAMALKRRCNPVFRPQPVVPQPVVVCRNVPHHRTHNPLRATCCGECRPTPAGRVRLCRTLKSSAFLPSLLRLLRILAAKLSQTVTTRRRHGILPCVQPVVVSAFRFQISAFGQGGVHA